MFDVALEEASKPSSAADRRRPGAPPNAKRQKKNEKFGHGGRKRHAKSNDAASSGDVSGFSSRANKARAFGAQARGGGAAGKKKRPGKTVRAGRRN